MPPHDPKPPHDEEDARDRPGDRPAGDNPPPGHAPDDRPPHDEPVDRDGHDRRSDRTDPGDDSADAALFVVAYEDDAERKRAEYLFNTWTEGELTKPEGLVRIARGVDADELHRELLTKFPADRVDSYGLAERDAPATPETRTVERDVPADADAVESFLRYVVGKQKASRRGDRSFEVYSRKGRAEVTYEVEAVAGDDGGEGTGRGDEHAAASSEATDAESTPPEAARVTVRISGHGPALDSLADSFATELDEFAANQ